VADDGIRERKIEALFELHKREVLLYVKMFGFDWFDAQELTQEVFVKLWRSAMLELDSLPRHYIYLVARTVCLDVLRRNGRQKRNTELTSSLEVLSTTGNGFQAKGPAVDDLSLLNIWVQRLPPDQKEIITLVYGAGYSIEEAAAVMGKKTRRAKYLLDKALGRLKQNQTRQNKGGSGSNGS
jgi:RNA polymerase sigma factor (sigma-70 family)